ncbi:MAG TPA: hypothetical protein VKZ50_18030 [bacterium]|nr:hypothetical protein [bacterium]
MRRVLAMLAIGVVTVLAPAAAMAQSTTSDDTAPAVGPVQVHGADLAPADLQPPVYLQGNGQGDGNGQ